MENSPTIECKRVMALRRRGGSTNKPFCDGTHGRIGVRDGRN